MSNIESHVLEVKCLQFIIKILKQSSWKVKHILLKKKVYHQDVQEIKLETQLKYLKTHFDEKERTTPVDIVDKMRNLAKSSLVFSSQNFVEILLGVVSKFYF